MSLVPSRRGQLVGKREQSAEIDAILPGPQPHTNNLFQRSRLSRLIWTAMPKSEKPEGLNGEFRDVPQSGCSPKLKMVN